MKFGENGKAFIYINLSINRNVKISKSHYCSLFGKVGKRPGDDRIKN
jgi:hypothetical protein